MVTYTVELELKGWQEGQRGRVTKGERGDPRGDGRTKSLKLPATLTHLISGAGQPDAVWEEKLLAADIGSTREPFVKASSL